MLVKAIVTFYRNYDILSQYDDERSNNINQKYKRERNETISILPGILIPKSIFHLSFLLCAHTLTCIVLSAQKSISINKHFIQ